MPRMPASSDEDEPRSVVSSEEDVKEEVVALKRGKGRPRKKKVQSPSPEPEPETEPEPELDTEEAEEGGGGDDDEEEEEDIFVVENIINHKYDEKGILKFYIRWQGYPKLGDHTWEPEENLEAASEILDEYISSIGGRDNLEKVRAKKRGRQSTNGTPSNGKKMRKVEHEDSKDEEAELVSKVGKIPPGNWEDLIKNIDTMDKAIDGTLQVLLTFKDGLRIRQPVSTVYLRCPQKMLKFYESHLSIVPATRATEESTNVEL